MTSGDGTTNFCLYAPNTAVGTFPASIDLTYYSGFSSTTVTFNQIATSCPARSGQTGQMYNGTSLPNGDTTYEGTASFTINNSATPGTYSWTLLLEEPGGGTNPFSTTHQIVGAETPDTGLTGRLVDSKTLQPWLYGAEIEVVQTNGVNVGPKGNTFVDLSDGTWTVDFGGASDDINLCSGSCTDGNEYATYQIRVRFTCNLNTANGTRPNATTSNDVNCPITQGGTDLFGVPSNFEITVTDSASGTRIDIGDIETERGPTAVTLQNIGTQAGAAPWLAMATLLLLVGTAVVIMRRRQA
jgi:hypothetical protein